MAPSRKARTDSTKSQPRLLAGGNPQIPKGEGEDPVRAYIAAMPGWKREVGAHLHDLIVRTVPDVQMAVKWNQPFYGLEGDGWFVSFRCFTRYVQLTFFRGSTLEPPPPKQFKDPEVRSIDIGEHDVLDEDQVISWIEQASRLRGRRL